MAAQWWSVSVHPCNNGSVHDFTLEWPTAPRESWSLPVVSVACGGFASVWGLHVGSLIVPGLHVAASVQTLVRSFVRSSSFQTHASYAWYTRGSFRDASSIRRNRLNLYD